MRSRVAEEKGEKYLEIRREPIVGIAVSGQSSLAR